MSFPSGDFKDPGPRIAGGVLESSKRHGGLLYPLAAQRLGVLHPVCQGTVGGRTQIQSLFGILVLICVVLVTIDSRLF